MRRRSRVELIQGWWRNRVWGFCPNCNNSPPKMDGCRICGCAKIPDLQFPYPKELRDLWWERFVGRASKLAPDCIHGKPIDQFCGGCFRSMRGLSQDPFVIGGKPRQG